MLKKFFVFGLLFADLIIAQSISNFPDYYTSEDTSIKNVCSHKFDIHVAAGLAAGGRFGLRYLFANNFSVEGAFGLNVRNFISLSDLQRKYSLGLNYHFDNSDAVLSFLMTYVEQPNSVYEAILFSPNFGLIPIKQTGLNAFFRIGVSIEVIRSFPSEKWEINDLGPNLDVGVSWNF